jgi:hypothetical protein
MEKLMIQRTLILFMVVFSFKSAFAQQAVCINQIDGLSQYAMSSNNEGMRAVLDACSDAYTQTKSALSYTKNKDLSNSLYRSEVAYDFIKSLLSYDSKYVNLIRYTWTATKYGGLAKSDDLQRLISQFSDCKISVEDAKIKYIAKSNSEITNMAAGCFMLARHSGSDDDQIVLQSKAVGYGLLELVFGNTK